MDKESAMHILKEGQKAKEILFNLVPNYIPLVKDFKERDDIEARLYRGVFGSYHTIMSSIQDEIYKEYPEVKKEFLEMMDKRLLKSKSKT